MQNVVSFFVQSEAIMDLRLKLISLFFLVFLVAVGEGVAQAELMSRVPELQKTARRAYGGGAGCGTGWITLVTTHGEMRIGTSLEQIAVFGEKAVLSELVAVLRARTDANGTGEKNPMSGDVAELTVLTIIIVAKSGDANAVPVMAALLEDRDERISGAALWNLIALAEADGLRPQIEQIRFPKSLIDWALRYRMNVPAWLKVKADN